LIYFICKNACRIAAKILFRYETIGVGRTPSQGPFLLMSNHVSNADPILLGVTCPRNVRYMAKAELFRAPLLGRVMPHLRAFPIERGKGERKALKDAIKVVRGGDPLLIFPEGSRSPDGSLRPGSRLVAMVAAQANAPCLPAYIEGSYEAWPKRHVLPRFGKVHIWYGEPFPLPEKAEDMSTKEHYQRCADLIMERIDDLRKQSLAERSL